MSTVDLLLIVEDLPSFASALRDTMRACAKEIRIATTIADARAQLRTWKPNAVLLDVGLPDGRALSLLEDLQALRPWPHLIAISGAADGEEVASLMSAGVRAFLSKPFDRRRLVAVWRETLEKPPDLTPLIRGAVGKISYRGVLTTVRDIMVAEAMDRCRGSRHGAARLLKITRQAIQQALRIRPVAHKID